MARVVAGLQPGALRVLLGLSENMEEAFLQARLVPQLALQMLEASLAEERQQQLQQQQQDATTVGHQQLLDAMYGPVLDYSSDDEDAAAAEGLAALLLAGGGKGAKKGKAAAAAAPAAAQEPQQQRGEAEPWFCGAARLGHVAVLKAAVAGGPAKPPKEQLAAALRAAALCGRREAYRLLLDECGAPAEAVEVERDLMAVATGSTGCSSGAGEGPAAVAAAARWARLQADRAGEAVQLLVAIARERGQLSQVGPELLLRALAAAARALQPDAVRALAATAHGAVAAGGGDGEEAVADAATALLWELVCGGPGAGEPLGMRGGIDDVGAAKGPGGVAEAQAPTGEELDVEGEGEDAALAPLFGTLKALVAAGGARVRLSLPRLRELQAAPGAAAAVVALPTDELVRVAAPACAGVGSAGGQGGDARTLAAVAGKGKKPWAEDAKAVAALAALHAGGKEMAPSTAAAAAAVAAAANELSWAEVPLLQQGPAAAAAADAPTAAKKRKMGSAESAAATAGEPADGVHVLSAAAHVGNATACLFFITGDGQDEDDELEEGEGEGEGEDGDGEGRAPGLPEEARPRPAELVAAVQVAARRGGGGAAGCWRLVDMLLGRLLCQVMMDQISHITGGGGGGSDGNGGGSEDGEQEGGGDADGKKRKRGAGPGPAAGGGGSAAELIATNPNLKLLCHVVSGEGASAGDIMAGRSGDHEGDDEDEGDGSEQRGEKEGDGDGVPASAYWVARALQLAASRGDVGRVVELMAGIEVRCRREREQQEQQEQQQEQGAAGAGEGEAQLTWGQAVLGRGVLAALRTAVGALAGARRLRAPAERRARLMGGRKVVQVLVHASGRQPAAAVAQGSDGGGAPEVRAAVAAAHAELHYACKAARQRGSGSGGGAALGFRWTSMAPAVRQAVQEGWPEAIKEVGSEAADQSAGAGAGSLWESWESSEEEEEADECEEEEDSEEDGDGEGGMSGSESEEDESEEEADC
ncbi:hypothetical protein HYH02_004697 [Chlamydomonas schloesseri]|uniref:Uncharacterized protein n=1 Tax=Chlamydomonas schloesseri TaxID=2026947 RepID=A0A836B927_9CHLO|nr:hypothetical protein HYH02_004697 [Chlamydomonas schloesseri]|eukprot:KAG2450864.1 hypothetical protein HYH02_004697 [Chlamydomonas schloesseri]